jgi:hypothetical protein
MMSDAKTLEKIHALYAVIAELKRIFETFVSANFQPSPIMSYNEKQLKIMIQTAKNCCHYIDETEDYIEKEI